MSLAEKILSFLYWALPAARGTISIPGTKLDHPTLGVVEFEDEGWWRGETKVGDRTIKFFIPDDGKGIDEAQADYCIERLTRFDDVLQDAVCLMSSKLDLSEAAVLDRFKPTELWGFSRVRGERLFYLSFADANDEYKLWRVQFNNEKATYLGYDD